MQKTGIILLIGLIIPISVVSVCVCLPQPIGEEENFLSWKTRVIQIGEDVVAQELESIQSR